MLISDQRLFLIVNSLLTTIPWAHATERRALSLQNSGANMFGPSHLPVVSTPKPREASKALRLAVVDDDPAVLDALKTIFETEGFLVMPYLSGAAFLAAEGQSRPDCLLLDSQMPAQSGTDVLTTLARRGYEFPVIIISGQGTIPIAVAAIRAGAHDFVTKPFEAGVIIGRIRGAVRAFRQQKPIATSRFPRSETLTLRETDVLDELARGQSNKETARILGISPRTVEVHRGRIMEKVGARNTADLMRIVLGGSSSGPAARS
jgi:two-component system, LuxR family, response regulator FixJ